jgi:hypothetical protein
MEVLTTTGECVRLTSQQADAMKLIKENQCNYYLNLSDTYVPLDLWTIIQNVYLNNEIFPAISVIDIRNTNLKLDDVDPRLRNMIVY